MSNSFSVGSNLFHSIILGFAVGDALGVPFEFLESDKIQFNYKDEMIGGGTHNQPAGTFSDDTSLLCCAIEALIYDNSLQRIADNFLKWKNENFWSARGEVFDIGNTTLIALKALENNGDLTGQATNNEYNCGNGSLMRILPLLPYTLHMDMNEKFDFIHSVSAITHGQIRNSIACFIYLEFAKNIIEDKTGNKNIILSKTVRNVLKYLQLKKETAEELKHYNQLFNKLTQHINAHEISNSGYVVDSLILSIHCFMKYNRYEMCVWYAISFGGDTDTNAALTGGLSALEGGIKEIPERWLNQLAKKNELFDLAERWNKSFNKITTCAI
jgi:ADP-ribosyl-[dinitrogen reductase] hydrolase